jgi:deoxyhypusine synthase
VSWGKIDPEKLPDTVVCYLDSTVAMPLIASYVLAKCKPRKPKRLYQRLPAMVEAMRTEYRKTELYARYWGKPAQPSAKSKKNK